MVIVLTMAGQFVGAEGGAPELTVSDPNRNDLIFL